ncbi:CRISPR-associated endonuclease Cas2 [Endozoicomonas sp. 2B-B]
MNQNNGWLICYDISCPRRLAKIHRYIRQEAFSLQRSVFYANLSRKDIENLVSNIQTLMDESTDDIRIIPARAGENIKWYGKPLLPEGIRFSGGPATVKWESL